MKEKDDVLYLMKAMLALLERVEGLESKFLQLEENHKKLANNLT